MHPSMRDFRKDGESFAQAAGAESKELHLSPPFKSLLVRFAPGTANQSATEHESA
jgi:hypothetical protein